MTHRHHDRRRPPARALAALALAAALAQGCYHYRVAARGEAGANPSTFPRARTLHNFAWGLVQDTSLLGVCAQDEALSSVRTSTNLGFALLTIATLGLYAPARVEYECVNPTPATGRIGAVPRPRS